MLEKLTDEKLTGATVLPPPQALSDRLAPKPAAADERGNKGAPTNT